MLVLVCPAADAADSVAIVLELEGTLSRAAKGDSQFSLSAEGERDWTLRLSGPELNRAREILRKSRDRKVFVTGTVQVRTVGGTIQLRDRMVQVNFLAPLTPAVRVTQVNRFSPADGRLKAGDIILEVGEAKKLIDVTTWGKLVLFLADKQGKTVNIVVERDGEPDPVLIADVRLGKGPAPLGISGDTIWRRGRSRLDFQMMNPPSP
jgi:hypothetical protein